MSDSPTHTIGTCTKGHEYVMEEHDACPYCAVEAIDDETLLITEDSNEFSFRRILEMLQETSTIILTIDPTDLDALKKGLGAAKFRENEKAERKDTRVLSYFTLTIREINSIDVQVTLGIRTSIKVTGIRIPGSDL